MNTQTLSQRLRELKAAIQGGNNAQARKLVHECIAQAEAMEGQAGELSDEEIKRILNANTYEDLNDSRQGGYVTSSDHDAYDMGMIAGLKYARDHGYLKPSQAIGEDERSPTMKEYTAHLADKFAHELAASQAIGEQTPVARMDPNDGNVLSAENFNDRVPEGRIRYTIPLGILPISPEARDMAIEALELARERFEWLPGNEVEHDLCAEALSALRK